MFGQVDDVITGDGVDGHGWHGQIHQNILAGANRVTCFIADAGADGNVTVGQDTWRYFHAPPAVGVDVGGVVGTVKVDGHALAHFGIAATADSQGCARFGGVNHVVAGDRIKGQGWCRQIDMDVLRRADAVARLIHHAHLNLGLAVSQPLHIHSRHRYRPLAIAADNRVVAVACEGDFHHLARFHVLGAAV
ncbi:hypothetical protein D3C79_454300 [compost metagenome]